jgi:vancomycin permeability regulator SanA
VTQAFHLPRALYLGRQLGLDSLGVAADRQHYPAAPRVYWKLRELAAGAAAVWEVHVTHPVPVLGEPSPIFPEDP